MKNFLFITHLSPKNIRSELRQGLIDAMQASLQAQLYPNWKALWLGEKEFQEDRIKEVAINGTTTLSNVYLRKDVLDYLMDCDYMVKLDDDDIIMPDALQIASGLSFDCYCDAYHTFYDITSGVLTQQKRNWIASTCVHKKEHAIKNLDGKGIADNFINSLFYGDHGKDWISYYQDKKLFYANKSEPVYVRVLSPTSITAGAKKFPVLGYENIDLAAYYAYLKTFGTWQNIHVSGFDPFLPELKANWKSFSGLDQSPIKGISFIEKVKRRLRSWLRP